MKKSVISLFCLVFSLVLISNDLKSQDLEMAISQKSSPSFLSVSVGCAFPTGRFRQKTIYDNFNNPYSSLIPKLPLTGQSNYTVAGFASSGLAVSANGAWFFLNYLGIGLRVFGAQNFLACNTLNNAYNTAYGEGYDFDFSAKDYYYTCFIAPALYFSIPVISNLYVSLEAGYGPFFSHFPEFSCTWIYDDSTVTEKTEAANTWDFSYFFGIGAKYKFENNFGISFDFNFNEFSTEYQITTTSEQNVVETTVPTVHRNFSLAVGFVVLFNN